LAAGKSAEWIKVYVHGQYGFIVDGRPVFLEYVDTVHCSDHSEPIPGIEIIRGWDFGLTPSCVFFQLTPRGQIIVFDELVSQDMGIDTFGEDVIGHSYRHYNNFKFRDFGDPAGQQNHRQMKKPVFNCFSIKELRLKLENRT